MSETAKVLLDGQECELPVITGTENEKAIDISKLRDKTGYVTLDTGYKNTGATTSAITFLDGEQEFFVTGDTQSNNWLRRVIFWRFLICCCTENCPVRRS